MRTGERGLALIKRYEALRLHAYDDGVGVWTIGWGHTKGVKPGMTITEGEAEAFLITDLAWAEVAVRRYISVPLKQSQFDALVSFTFNVGAGALRDSTLRKKINQGAHEYVVREMGQWIKGGGRRLKGLARRRAAEAVLYWRTE